MNRIEHRVVRHITQYWWTMPLTNRRTVVELMAATTTDAEMNAFAITGDASRPEWNYLINPRDSR